MSDLPSDLQFLRGAADPVNLAALQALFASVGIGCVSAPATLDGRRVILDRKGPVDFSYPATAEFVVEVFNRLPYIIAELRYFRLQEDKNLFIVFEGGDALGSLVGAFEDRELAHTVAAAGSDRVVKMLRLNCPEFLWEDWWQRRAAISKKPLACRPLPGCSVEEGNPDPLVEIVTANGEPLDMATDQVADFVVTTFERFAMMSAELTFYRRKYGTPQCSDEVPGTGRCYLPAWHLGAHVLRKQP